MQEGAIDPVRPFDLPALMTALQQEQSVAAAVEIHRPGHKRSLARAGYKLSTISFIPLAKMRYE